MKRIELPRLQWKPDSRTGIECPTHRVTWTEAGKRRERTIRLAWEGDPQRLTDLYWECEAGRHPRQVSKAESRYSWGSLIKLWREDPRVQNKLADSTKVSYRRRMDRFLAKNSKIDMRRTLRADVRRIHNDLAGTPREADWMIQIISLLWNYARHKQDWRLGDNPAASFDLFGVSQPFEPWPDWMVKAALDAPPVVRTTVELMLGCGERPGAAIEKTHDAFDGEFMWAVDEKTGTRFQVFAPPRLRDYVGTLPVNGRHILAKNLTEPLGYNSVSKHFAAWRDTLGPEAKLYSLHGLRKLAIIQLAEAGCTDAEIQAITNQSMETIRYYRQMADRKKLSKQGQERRT